ncbi:phasin family protein [Ferrimonas aestuarii]|uniref:Phasin family protein n=1 Tax=Ferrimonas aestuarii TaxID=2569539 RepID=A0A4U1BNR5_9GAMM|nr:phasin family protein [Ferrimonas aestuarii]TKB53684.1 phasin family protein [Ferrimonas aestuarii]
MYMDMLKQLQQQSQAFQAPVTQFNQLMAENYQRVSRLQLDAAQHYGELGIDQVKSASEVTDLPSMMAFTSKQMQLMNEISSRVMQDMQALNEIGQEFKTSVDKMTRPA